MDALKPDAQAKDLLRPPFACASDFNGTTMNLGCPIRATSPSL